MITLLELLEDKTFKQYFLTKPVIPAVAASLSPPWRVYVQLEGRHGRWGRKSFDTYTEAFKWLKPRLHSFHDAAITCPKVTSYGPTRMVKIKGRYVEGSDGVKRQATKRVPWKPKIPADEIDEHRWCPYCRRPTAFRWFSQHHALGKLEGVSLSFRRCVICGASENMLGRTLYPVRKV